MTKLKPCPICGAKPVVETWASNGFMCMVKCNGPDCPVPIDGYPKSHNIEEAIEAWNRRVKTND